MTRSISPARKFRLDPGLGDVLDALLDSQLEKHLDRMKAEVKAREITDATRHVFVTFGWLLPAASADPRLVEVTEPEGLQAAANAAVLESQRRFVGPADRILTGSIKGGKAIQS